MAKKGRKSTVAKRSLSAGSTNRAAKGKVEFVGGPALVQVTVSLSAPTSANRVFLDKEEFALDANGTGRLQVSPGTYTLFWDVYGGDGQNYTVKLSTPASAKWDSGARTIGGDHDIGTHYPVEVKS